jgi:uncharacterized phage protein (TIGR02220 family)
MSQESKEFGAGENHSYNVNVAALFKNPGKAVILKEMARSYLYYRRMEVNEKDGFYWFFIRMGKLDKLYPEYSRQSIYRWVKEFEELCLVASRSDMNQHGYDRTRWFTVNIEAYRSLERGEDHWLESDKELKTGLYSDWYKRVLKALENTNSQSEKCNSQSENTNSQSEKCNSQNGTTIHPLINPPLNPPLNPHNVDQGGQRSFDLPLEEKVKKGKKKVKEELIKDAQEVLRCLNETAGRGFAVSLEELGGEGNVMKVVKLMKRGASREVLELMIMYKCFEWMGGDMEKYLQPSTLFGGKAMAYIQQAKEAEGNPNFARAVKRFKDKELRAQNGGKRMGGDISRSVAERLKSW